MRRASNRIPESAEKTVRDIRRATRRHHSAEEKIRIVLEDLRGEVSIAELCRKEGINQNLYYRWSKTSIDGFIAKKALSAPEEDRYRPVWVPPRERPQFDYRAAGITSVVWCIGFRTDYSWIDLLFNGRGQPSHVRGVTPVPGAYFVGLPWLYTWGSGRFSGVARDAEYLAEHIKARIRLSGSERQQAAVNEAAIGS